MDRVPSLLTVMACFSAGSVCPWLSAQTQQWRRKRRIDRNDLLYLQEVWTCEEAAVLRAILNIGSQVGESGDGLGASYLVPYRCLIQRHQVGRAHLFA